MFYTERQKDILNIASSLDIPPYLYRNAVEKYKNITDFLESKGFEALMYPQGSFALGTVVRPNVKNPDASYDLDFICQVYNPKSEYSSASELRKKLNEVFTNSTLYGGKVAFSDKCITINYADIGSISFSIDIVPATAESPEIIGRLTKEAEYPELIPTSIAIPKHCEKNYNWCTNNPKGYKAWFDKINAPFIAYSRESFRKSLFEANTRMFAKVEEIPSELERSSIQRVIQILKYHRDNYYAKLENGDDIKPISAIISTVVARMSEGQDASLGVFDLLKYILSESNLYSQQQILNESDFYNKYGAYRRIIRKQSSKWYIDNPANPEDNLADQWDNNMAKTFFAWLDSARVDLIDSLMLSENQFRIAVENAFGSNSVNKVLGEKYKKVAPKPISNSTNAKPWQE